MNGHGKTATGSHRIVIEVTSIITIVNPIARFSAPRIRLVKGLNGFALFARLWACRRRRPIPQLLDIAQGGWILGVALENVLKLFEGIIQLSLFV